VTGHTDLVIAAIAVLATCVSVCAPTHLFVLRSSSPLRVEVIDGRPRTVIGRSHPDAIAAIADRTIAIVRRYDPAAEIVDAPFAPPVMAAARNGKAFLIMPTIEEWREGARKAGEGDRVDLKLELARVDFDATLASVADVRYHASASGVAAAFSTSDKPASRLLDSDRFRKAVLKLLAPIG